MLRLVGILLTLTTLWVLAYSACSTSVELHATSGAGAKQRLIVHPNEPVQSLLRRLIARFGLPVDSAVQIDPPFEALCTAAAPVKLKLNLAAAAAAQLTRMSLVTHKDRPRRGLSIHSNISSWDPYVLRDTVSGGFRVYFLAQDVSIGLPALFWGRSWIYTAW